MLKHERWEANVVNPAHRSKHPGISWTVYPRTGIKVAVQDLFVQLYGLWP